MKSKMNTDGSSDDTEASKLQLEKDRREYEEFLRKTFAEAEAVLELEPGTLADTNKDNDFLAIMKMSSTIEPLINQALEAEIKSLRKLKVEHEGANALAKFVRDGRSRNERAKLAMQMGLLSDSRLKFVLSVYQLRDHYAHNVRNFHLDIFEIIKKIETDDAKIIFDLSGLDRKGKHGKILVAILLKTFVYQRFAGFLSDALHILKPPTLGFGGLLSAQLGLEKTSPMKDSSD